MQDRFKFRFWNKDIKRMETFNGCPDAIGDILTNEIKSEPYIIMQSTGLKDKNGKLIYEGDVILEQFYISKSKVIKTIIYDNDACCFALVGDGITYSQLCASDKPRLEVIGNIYENADLLRAEEQEQIKKILR